MRSVSGKNWEEIVIDNRKFEKIRIEKGFSQIISKLIIHNNFDEEEILSINNSIKIKNPFLNEKDFLDTVELIDKSIQQKEKICIIGDYDVDGCVSSSLLINFLKKLDALFYYHIPNRFKNGYGTNLDLICFLIQKKPKLVIFLDNGSNSNEVIDYLSKNGIKSLIIDHHEIYKPYPKSNVLINPKKVCRYSSYNYFCTTNLIYFLIDLFIIKKKIDMNISHYLPFVLLSILADVMPLRKINRFIAIDVMKNFKLNDLDLFKEIFKIKNLKKPIQIEDLSFLIAPILNAPGRVDDANKVVKLLTTKSKDQKYFLIKKVVSLNEKRKKIEEIEFKKINLDTIKKTINPVIFLEDKNIHEGIMGIIAARIKEYFGKPCIVLTKSNDLYKASARSTLNFNIGHYIRNAINNKIIIKGGGHNLAAGFSLKENKIEKLKTYLNTEYSKKNIENIFRYVSKISVNSISKNFFNEFSKINPFGLCNEQPSFLIEDVKILKPKSINNRFISCLIKSRFGKSIQAISFHSLDSEISKNLYNNKNYLNLIVRFKENFWNNKRNLQLEIIDLIINPIKA